MSSAPVKGKPFDKDALYKKMVDYYMAPPRNYTKEHANEVAQRIVEQQILKRKTR